MSTVHAVPDYSAWVETEFIHQFGWIISVTDILQDA